MRRPLHHGRERPNELSPLYTEPFTIENKELKAVAFLHGEKGAVYSQRFGFAKNGWKINGGSHAEHPATAAADENANTYWLSIAQEKQPSFTIDLGRTTTVSGIAYLPPQVPNVGMAAAGYVETSQDGKQWAKTEDFTFGNIVYNPTRRYQYFNHPIKEVRYIRFVITETAGSNQAVGAAGWEVF